jgi:hypothetical protein
MSRVTPIQLCVYKEIFSWKKVPTVSNRLTHVASANTQSEIRQQSPMLWRGVLGGYLLLKRQERQSDICVKLRSFRFYLVMSQFFWLRMPSRLPRRTWPPERFVNLFIFKKWRTFLHFSFDSIVIIWRRRCRRQGAQYNENLLSHMMSAIRLGQIILRWTSSKRLSLP